MWGWLKCLPNIIEVQEDIQSRALGYALFQIGDFDRDSYRGKKNKKILREREINALFKKKIFNSDFWDLRRTRSHFKKKHYGEKFI